MSVGESADIRCLVTLPVKLVLSFTKPTLPTLILEFFYQTLFPCSSAVLRYYDARILIVLVATVLASLFVTLCHFLLQRMLAQLPVGPRGLKPRALRKMRAMHVLSICLVALTVASSVRSMRRGAPGTLFCCLYYYVCRDGRLGIIQN